MRQRMLTGCGLMAIALSVLAADRPADVAPQCGHDAEKCAARIKEEYQTRGWSGIEEGEPNEEGAVPVRIVVPGSPAERAGVRTGDLLVSLEGMTLSPDNQEPLAELRHNGMRIGRQVTYGIKRADEILMLRLTLARIPPAVLAAAIEAHSRERHPVARHR